MIRPRTLLIGLLLIMLAAPMPGVAAAADAPDPATAPLARMQALLEAGRRERRQSDHRRAITLLEPGLRLAREASTLAHEGTFANVIGMSQRRLGRYQDVLGHDDRALALYRGLGDRPGEEAVQVFVVLAEIEPAVGRISDSVTRQSAELSRAHQKLYCHRHDRRAHHRRRLFPP